MFIVTNCAPGGNYTPSVFKTFEEAEEWMLECTANNIKESNIPIYFSNMNNKEVCQWAVKNIPDDFKITKDKTELYYSDESYNIMQIFEVEDY